MFSEKIAPLPLNIIASTSAITPETPVSSIPHSMPSSKAMPVNCNGTCCAQTPCCSQSAKETLLNVMSASDGYRWAHPLPFCKRELRITNSALLPFCTTSSGSLAERAMKTSSAWTDPEPSTVNAGVASTICVPVSSIAAAAEVPKAKPAHRAPNPVDERVAAPASKTPLTVMSTPSETRNDTPS